MKYAIGIDLGGTFIKAGLVSSDGTLTRARQVPTDARSGGAAVGRQIAEVAQAIYRESNSRSEIVGIGVGSPGLILADSGIVHFSPNFLNEDGSQWADVPLARHVRESLGDLSRLPVFLDNDVNAMTLGEFAFGAGRDVNTLVAMTLGTGVGGGIVLDGRVYRGPANTAGEIGHMTVVPTARRCGCGNYGCLEALVGTAGLLARTREAIVIGGRDSTLASHLDDLTPRMIADAAHEGDAVAREIFADTGRYIGIALASLANFLNPEMAVVGGGISAAGEEILFRYIRREIERRAMGIPAETMQVVRAELGNDAGIVGSATLALQAADIGPGN